MWGEAHALVQDAYKLSLGLPKDERYGITSQLRRAAVSVPSNIAEGTKRASAREYARFLNVAEASLVEAEYLLMLARDLGLLPATEVSPFFPRIDRVARMLHALRKSVLAAAEGERQDQGAPEAGATLDAGCSTEERRAPS
ncbi:MAG: four helix bundle protein [Myxococcales bacterium]|nr:four helix bundle protein [Myxococcales bacterium]